MLCGIGESDWRSCGCRHGCGSKSGCGGLLLLSDLIRKVDMSLQIYISPRSAGSCQGSADETSSHESRKNRHEVAGAQRMEDFQSQQVLCIACRSARCRRTEV